MPEWLIGLAVIVICCVGFIVLMVARGPTITVVSPYADQRDGMRMLADYLGAKINLNEQMGLSCDLEKQTLRALIALLEKLDA